MNYVKHDRSLLMFILLSFVTCGIYSIYFWYQYVNDLNTVCDGDGKETHNYIIVLLLSIVTCGIYHYIWEYGVGNRLQENARRYDLEFSENGTTVLMWGIFGMLLCGVGFFIAYHIMIKNMNALAAVYNSRNIVDTQDNTQYQN